MFVVMVERSVSKLMEEFDKLPPIPLLARFVMAASTLIDESE